MWTFDAQPLEVTTLLTAPSSPRAGRPFALTMGVRRSETGAAVTRGEVSCSLRVGSTWVPVRTSGFANRRAACVFDVPAGTTGRRYHATIAVASRGSDVRRSVSGRVS